MNLTNIKRHIPFLFFFVILISRLPLSGDFATSVVPGWHTPIFPPYFVLGIIVTLCLFFSTIGYWKLAKNLNKINIWVFITHLLLTLPAIIFIDPYTILPDMEGKSMDEKLNQFLTAIQLFYTFNALFFIGQILFAGYFFKYIYLKKHFNT